VARIEPGRALAWAAEAVGLPAEALTLEPMAGASSSSVYAVRAREPGGAPELVLRLFTNRRWLDEEPDLARHEAAALQEMARIGITAPQLVAWEETSAVCGAPAVLMTRMPGRVVLRPDNLDAWLEQLAAAIRPVHDHSAAAFPWERQPYSDLDTLAPPPWSPLPRLWQRAIDHLRRTSPPQQEMRLIHRDYHPTNVLWQGDTVSGIVDWVNACRGPVGIDIGRCRANLAVLHGVEVAERFLQIYESMAGSDWRYEPYWDLADLADMLPNPDTVRDGWRTHGVDDIPAPVARLRVDAYLASVVARI
jgi:Ser/Thr protein kinase RdoA (MazF antagonist)